MNRRGALKGMLGVSAMTMPGFRLPLADAADYPGKFFVFVQADGGWDPTSFCDPKENAQDWIINHWAERDETQWAGNIAYAPFAKNKTFFDEHHDKMLVINGVDAQTNSHTAGIVHNWSGRISEGYPTTSALLAAHFAPEDLPVPYLSFGGFSNTSGVTRFTRLNNPGLLRSLAAPELADGNPVDRYMGQADWDALTQYSNDAAKRLVDAPFLLPMDADNRRFYGSAFANAEGLEAYAAAVPSDDDLEQPVLCKSCSGDFFRSDLRRQAQLTVLAFKSRVSVSADLWQGGFDTHEHHDQDHEWLLGQLTEGVDYLWRFAEEQGVADDLVVVMGSDFGRTNKYNAQEGKDHWPIGSFVIMEKGQSWNDQAVGETDELHFARQKINPQTLEPDDSGSLIHPKHIHKALRRYLGIEDTESALRFPFNNTEDFAFFR